jgi:hypothetical protein
MYERWHEEIEQLTGAKPKEPEKARRRRKAMERAGYPDGVLPDGLTYAHGAVVTYVEMEAINERMRAMGDARPRATSGAYYQLAAKYLAELRRQEAT